MGKSNFDTLTVTKKEEENAVVVFLKFKRRKKEGVRYKMRLPRPDKSGLAMKFKDRMGKYEIASVVSLLMTKEETPRSEASQTRC